MVDLAILLTAASVLAVVVRELRRRRFLRELETASLTERNRNRFGVIRTQLMQLARGGKTDIRGRTFELLYTLLTMLMRRPDSYTKVAEAIIKAPVCTGNEADGWHVSPEEGALFAASAHALDQLCRDFYWPYRFLAWVYDRGGPNALPLYIQMRQFVKRTRLKHSKPVKTYRLVRGASRRLEHIGRSSGSSRAMA